MDPAAAIRQAAAEVGFARCGFASLRPLPRAKFVRDWLAEGRAGEMVYLRRRLHARLDPRRLAPWARSVISVAYPYPPPPSPPADWRRELRGRVAGYARGVDYHAVMTDRLRGLALQVTDLGNGGQARVYVDTGPVLEREWGARAGLGWIGRNTMLLDRRLGSWFLLGEILTELDLADEAPEEDRCGSCRRGLDACPTGALDDGFRLDPRLCISYLTIEHRGAIPAALRPKLGNWIFGCDACQDVCPWNEAGDPAGFEELYPSLPALLDLDARQFRLRFGRTALARTRRRGLLRNAAVALGNSGSPEAVPPLTRALSDSEPLVRGHAVWGLGRLGGRRAKQALERAWRTEADPWVRTELSAALSVA